MVRPAGSLVESGRAIGRIRARALPHEAISSIISAAGLHARPVLRFLLRRARRRACPRAHAPAVEGNQTSPMKIVELVDDLYEAFADRLGQVLSASARDLPRALRLAPTARPWSRVFPHAVTLGAPALFAESLSGVPSSLTRDA